MSFDEKTQAYADFLKQKNIFLSPKVAITDFRAEGQGRGLRAEEDISKGETLFTVPTSSILRAETDGEIAQLTAKHELDSWSALIVRMMAAQTSSEWKPYFDVLPTEFNTPMFWDAGEAEKLLRGSEVLAKIGRESADELYDQLASTVLKEPALAELPENARSRDAFHRMGSLIMSYAFDVPAQHTKGDNSSNNDEEEEEEEDEESQEDEGKAMVPLADALNSHSRLQNAELTTPENTDDNFEMVASRDIKKGEQIYVLYGDQPSGDMLRRYGFVETGGTNYEVVEISRSLITEVAQQFISTKQIEERDEKFSDNVGDVDSFEIALTLDEEEGDEAVPELEIEPVLLIYLNSLVAPELKRKQFKEIVSLSEGEKILGPAKQLFSAVIEKRKQQYGEVTPVNINEAPKTLVWLAKEDMCAQVRQAEIRVLDMTEDWLSTAEVADVSNKKQRIN